MRRIIQGDQQRLDFVQRIMGRYGISRWRSRLHALILRQNPVLSEESASPMKPSGTGTPAGLSAHARYYSHTTRLLTQISAPVYLTSRIVQVNRSSPVNITHRSSMTFLTQAWRDEGMQDPNISRSLSGRETGSLVQAGLARASAGKRHDQALQAIARPAVHRPAISHAPTVGSPFFSPGPTPAAPAISHSPAAASNADQEFRKQGLTIESGTKAAVRQEGAQQPLYLIHNQIRMLQELQAYSELPAASLNRAVRSAAFQAVERTARHNNTAAAANPFSRESREGGEASASAAFKRTRPTTARNQEPALTLASALTQPLKLALGNGLERILVGVEERYGGRESRLAPLERTVPGKPSVKPEASERMRQESSLAAEPQSRVIPERRSLPVKYHSRRSSGYAAPVSSLAFLPQETDANGNPFGLPLPIPIQHAGPRRHGEVKKSSPSMRLAYGPTKDSAAAVQDILPTQAKSAGLVYRRPEPALVEREELHQQAETSPRVRDVSFQADSPSSPQKQKTVMGADEIHLLAERVFQVLEKRLSIQKDRRGLR
jgi:hypothetical protein